MMIGLKNEPIPTDERVMGSFSHHGMDKSAGFNLAVRHRSLSLEDSELSIGETKCWCIRVLTVQSIDTVVPAIVKPDGPPDPHAEIVSTCWHPKRKCISMHLTNLPLGVRNLQVSPEFMTLSGASVHDSTAGSPWETRAFLLMVTEGTLPPMP